MNISISVEKQCLVIKIPLKLSYEVIKTELAAGGMVLPRLTPREREILKLVFNGTLAAKELSTATALSVRTVKFHLSQIYRKFGVLGRAELISKFAILKSEHLL